ncbi:hypothetical protein ACFOVU_17330 [Nocardiopsis sediminis]|uniref:Uncharacterized protein n=1 Tax=Nocardiopsis sediminis TaxID=1778267 RepID=A0ABV8FNR3_9ACTN
MTECNDECQEAGHRAVPAGIGMSYLFSRIDRRPGQGRHSGGHPRGGGVRDANAPE